MLSTGAGQNISYIPREASVARQVPLYGGLLNVPLDATFTVHPFARRQVPAKPEVPETRPPVMRNPN
jgi:hypothetical protein